jgi:hypothetical protein
MRRQPFTRAALLVAVSLAASAGPAAAQSRPQLTIVQAEADLAAETLLIQGEYFVWANDDPAAVRLAGNPLTVLSIDAGHILAQLPPWRGGRTLLAAHARARSTPPDARRCRSLGRAARTRGRPRQRHP